MSLTHPAKPESPVEQARFNMVQQQIRPWSVGNSRVLELLESVKREDFVPQHYRSLAFTDMEIPLPAHQVMLAPKVVARALQDLALQPRDNVLQIGTGSGYMTALLAHMVNRVVGLEIVPELAELTRQNVTQAGLRNVEVRVADASQDAEVEGPFDVIVLCGSVQEVPSQLLSQLKTNGRLFAIVGDEPMMRATVVTRVDAQRYETRQPWDTVAPRLQNFPEKKKFNF